MYSNIITTCEHAWTPSKVGAHTLYDLEEQESNDDLDYLFYDVDDAIDCTQSKQ